MTLRVVLAMAFLIVCNANSWAGKIPRGDFGGKALSCLRVDPVKQLEKYESILGIDFSYGAALGITIKRFGDEFRFIEKQLGEVVVDHSTLQFGSWLIDRKTLLATSDGKTKWRCEVHSGRGELMGALNPFKEEAKRNYDDKAAGNKI